MDERLYGSEDEGCPYSWLNEWLCEYVDGTMDPSVRVVFDEYLKANPELAEHVERLCHTRQLLCACNSYQRPTPRELHMRLHRQMEGEMMREQRPVLPTAADRLSMTAAVASAVIVTLAVGVVVGATLFADPRQPGTAEASPPVRVVQKEWAPGHGPQQAAGPLELLPALQYAPLGMSMLQPITRSGVEMRGIPLLPMINDTLEEQRGRLLIKNAAR